MENIVMRLRRSGEPRYLSSFLEGNVSCNGKNLDSL
jgi:hypothetical protein